MDEQLLRALSDDRNLALETFFGDQHEDKTPAFHLEIVDLWASRDEFVMIEGFRESGKTTRALEFLALEAAFGNFRFGLFIADNYTKACDKLDIVRWHLKENKGIRALFGDVASGGKDNASILMLSNGTKLQAMGREQSPRGLLNRTARPDRIYIDDPENRERGDVASIQAVDNTMKWLYGDVIPAMDKRNGKVRINATPMARDCLVSRLREDPSWVTRRYPIVLGDIDSDDAQAMWSDRYPVNWVRQRRDMARSQGMLTAFMQEYMCVSEEDSEKVFPPGMFVDQPTLGSSWQPVFVTVDPARTSKKSSNLTGITVFGLSGSRITVLHSEGARIQPSEIVQRVFDLNSRYSPVCIGIESNSLEEFLMQPLRREMVERNTSLPLVELRAPHDMRKHDFIRGLQPFYGAGDIALVGGEKAHRQLVNEFRDFPSKNDDVINALAYALRIRPGMPCYEEFGEYNIVDEVHAQRAQPVYLAFNASSREVTCVAFQVVQTALVVLRDWVIPQDTMSAVQQIKMEVNAEFASSRLVPFAPADQHDDWGHTGLVAALKKAEFKPSRATSTLNAAGSLIPYIRTVWKGKRALLVPTYCQQTINALAVGYALPVGPGGREGGVPLDNPHRTLIQGMECLVSALDSGINQRQVANYGTAIGGQRYITSRPGISMRR